MQPQRARLGNALQLNQTIEHARFKKLSRTHALQQQALSKWDDLYEISSAAESERLPSNIKHSLALHVVVKNAWRRHEAGRRTRKLQRRAPAIIYYLLKTNLTVRRWTSGRCTFQMFIFCTHSAIIGPDKSNCARMISRPVPRFRGVLFVFGPWLNANNDYVTWALAGWSLYVSNTPCVHASKEYNTYTCGTGSRIV